MLPNSTSSLLRGFTADIRKFEAYMKEESEKKMRDLSRLFSTPASRIHTHIVFGNVRDEILALSEKKSLTLSLLAHVNRVFQPTFLVQTLNPFYAMPTFRC